MREIVDLSNEDYKELATIFLKTAHKWEDEELVYMGLQAYTYHFANSDFYKGSKFYSLQNEILITYISPDDLIKMYHLLVEKKADVDVETILASKQNALMALKINNE